MRFSSFKMYPCQTSCCNGTLCECDFHAKLGYNLCFLLATSITADEDLVEWLRAQGLPFSLCSNPCVEYVMQNYLLGCLAIFEKELRYWIKSPHLCHPYKISSASLLLSPDSKFHTGWKAVSGIVACKFKEK